MTSAVHMKRRSVLNHVSLAENTVNLLLYAQPLQHYITSLVNSHLIEKVQIILSCLTQSSRMSQDHVFRIICCLMSSRISAKVFRLTDHWSLLMKNVLTSCCIKYEILAEFLTKLIANGFYKVVKNEYNTVWRKKRITYVTAIVLEQITVSSVALTDYLSCLEDLNSSSQPQHTDMILDQVQNIWQTVLTNEPGPLDFLIPRILDIYIYKNEFDEGLECLISYKNQNPNNLNAYIYIFKFVVYCGTDNEETMQTIEDCFHQIVQLSPSSPLILEILDHYDIDSSYLCNVLMEFVDFTSNKDDHRAWRRLYRNLKKLSSEELETIQDHYESTYSSYWPEYHWKSSPGSDASPKLKKWKEKVEYKLDKRSISSSNIRRSSSSSLSSVQTISKAKRPKLQPKIEEFEEF